MMPLQILEELQKAGGAVIRDEQLSELLVVIDDAGGCVFAADQQLWLEVPTGVLSRDQRDLLRQHSLQLAKVLQDSDAPLVRAPVPDKAVYFLLPSGRIERCATWPSPLPDELQAASHWTQQGDARWFRIPSPELGATDEPFERWLIAPPVRWRQAHGLNVGVNP